MNKTVSDAKVGENTTLLISVAMPVYNGERYLAEAIDSILAQTFADFELIIIDDGSTDNSLQVLREYQKRDARIRLIARENRNLATTLNDIIDLARGEYIARMDQDDVSSSDRLEKQVAFMEAHPEIGLVSSNAEIIKADGAHLMNMSYPNSHTLMLWSMCFFDPIPHPTVFMRRSLVMQAGGYRNLLPAGEQGFPEDYDLWTRMIRMEHAQFHNLPERLVKLRKHESNITTLHIENILRNSAIVSHNHIEFVLGHETPLDYSQVFWKQVRDRSFLSPAMDLLEELVQLFLRTYPVTRAEKNAIKKDAAWRLIQMLPGQLFSRYGALMIWRAFLYDPFFLWNSSWKALPLLNSKLQRHIAKMR